MTQYSADTRELMADCDARASRLDEVLGRELPEWLAWEVPSILLELERGGAPVCPQNQAKIRGLLSLHLTGECFASAAAFEALAWLLSGVEAPGMRAHPIDLLHALDAVRAVAGAHEEVLPAYATEVLERIATVCGQEGYIALPSAYGDVQALICKDLEDHGFSLDIEKKARELCARSPLELRFDESPEGVAAARLRALELSLR